MFYSIINNPSVSANLNTAIERFSPENGIICKLTESLAYAGGLAQILLQQVGEDL